MMVRVSLLLAVVAALACLGAATTVDVPLSYEGSMSSAAHNRSGYAVFILNMKRRVDRRAATHERLPAAWRPLASYTSDWDVPTDGRALSLATLRALNVSLYAGWELRYVCGFEVCAARSDFSRSGHANHWWSQPMSAGEVGCALGHLFMWRRARAAFAANPQLRAVVVLEDDIRPAPDTVPRFEAALAELGGVNHWDLLYLGRNAVNAEPAVSPNRPFVRPGYSFNTHAYALTSAGVDKLLAMAFDRNLIPADEALSASFMEHPRPDVAQLFPPRLLALALSPCVIDQDAQMQGSSETVHTPALTELHSVTVSAPDAGKARVLVASFEAHRHNFTVLGHGVQWQGTDMAGPGGGQKINMVREWLASVPDDEVVLFSDGHDSFVTAGPSEFLRRWRACGCDVLFGAEAANWPGGNTEQPALATRFRYLNSGGYIGRAGVLKQMFATPVEDAHDDQLYCQNLYTSRRWNVKLDASKTVFGTLSDHVRGGARMVSHDDFLIEETGTHPLQLHGNGPAKELWTLFAEHRAGLPHFEVRDRRSLRVPLNSALPCNDAVHSVMIAASLTTDNVQLARNFLASIDALTFGGRVLQRLVVHAATTLPQHMAELAAAYPRWTFVVEPNADRVRQVMFDRWRTSAPRPALPHLLFLEDKTRLQPEALSRLLCSMTRSQGRVLVLSPLLREDELNRQMFALWSNVWTAISDTTGDFLYSTDYADIAEGRDPGVYAVAHTAAAYLVAPALLDHIDATWHPRVFVPQRQSLPYGDLEFTYHLRQRLATLPHVDTHRDLGVVQVGLRDPPTPRVTLYDYLTRPEDWKAAYLTAEWHIDGASGLKSREFCPEAFEFLLFSKRFCDELIAIMEKHGGWSGGRREYDERIGGVEPVPTQDIHMHQVGLGEVWSRVVMEIIAPLASRTYNNFKTNKVHIAFVVRYSEGGQRELEPHHDFSFYTTNIALNQGGVDYQGGGCEFIRTKCMLQNATTGAMSLHPGSMTHYHRGIGITSGTRYILVSFIM